MKIGIVGVGFTGITIALVQANLRARGRSRHFAAEIARGLTLWDWPHGTLRLNVSQSVITIGVPAYRLPVEVTLPKRRRDSLSAVWDNPATRYSSQT